MCVTSDQLSGMITATIVYVLSFLSQIPTPNFLTDNTKIYAAQQEIDC